jgi:ferredoxin--NADP+ reductase
MIDEQTLETVPPAFNQVAEARNLHAQPVTWVHHWSEDLFSFRIRRPQSFRFRSGEFVMIGLLLDDRALLRAYSIVSPSWEDHLEFFSIKVPDGALTSRLQNLKVGDSIFLGKKPTGTLVTDALTPARRLFLVATGTGLAPFLSILRDPETHEKFDRIIITHTVRWETELAYRTFLEEEIREDEIFGEVLRDRFVYYPTVTRDEFHTQGRITDLIRSGKFADDLGLVNRQFDPMSDRFMICGSMGFNREMAALLKDYGFREGKVSEPAEYVIERAFVG